MAGVCLVTFLTPSQASAADVNGKFTALGAGRAPCSRFVEARQAKSTEYYLFGGWMEGFLSARNQVEEETFSLAPWQSTDLLAGFLADYCAKHPEEPFITAVRVMAQALQPQRMKESSPTVTLTVGPVRQQFFVEALRRVQSRLKDLGFYKGAVDGDFGKESAAALKAYQQREGIEETGFPDQLSLFKLLR